MSARARFLPVADRPFVTIESDGVALSTAGPRVDLCLFDDESELAGAIVRVRYSATEEQHRRIDHAAITAALYEAGAYKVTGIHPTIERAARARVDGMDETMDERQALDAWLMANGYAEELGTVRGTITPQGQALCDLTDQYLAEARA